MKEPAPSFRGTILACYAGYITQAVVNNFLPLLFVTLQTAFSLSLAQITLLVTVNFITQLFTDLLSAKHVDRMGYRVSVVAAHVLCCVGLVGVGLLPRLLPSAYLGLLLSVVIYAVGGGLIEVLISPIVEGCPSENKSAAMSLLHSFYCWGCVAVILLTTAAFTLFGRDCWPYVACCWALLPAVNAVAFTRVPIRRTVEREEQLPLGALLKSGLFWLLALFGDLGCSAGPTVVGFVSGAAGDNLKAGLLVAAAFPLVILLGVTGLRHGARRNLSSC